jgi:hypothetical protein
MIRPLVVALALLAAPASAQTLPQPSTKGNAPTVVCVTLQTTTTVQLNGAPIASPPPNCINIQDADLPKLYAPFVASCVPPSGPPPCTPLQVAATIADYIHNRLLDRINDFQAQAAAAAAVQSIVPPTLTPAQ